MIWMRKCKNAMITVELGVSLVLVLLVLFVTIGMFNDNLKDMFANGNFKNVFNGTSARTFFSYFNKNYSNSQIDVMLLGEQGLERLRQKANNSVISIVDSASGSGKSLAESLSDSSLNTISYLSQVINLIMGSSSAEICNKLHTPSTAVCANLTGVKYKVSISKGYISISDSSSNALLSQAKLSTSITTPSVSKDANVNEKLTALQTLSLAYTGSIISSYSLTREITKFANKTSSLVAIANGSGTPDGDLTTLIGQLSNKVDSAYNGCHNVGGFLGSGLGWVVSNSCSPRITQDDVDRYTDASYVIKEQLASYKSAADSAGANIQQSSPSSGIVEFSTVKSLCAQYGTCDENMTSITISTKDSIGREIKAAFSLNFIQSPLTDSRLMSTSNLATRLAVLESYNTMLDSFWNDASDPVARMIDTLNDDNYNDQNACSVYLSGLSTIAKKYGLTSLYNDISSHSDRCKVDD